MPTIKKYFYDGGSVGAAFAAAGTVVGDNTKRQITSAIVCNDTGVARLFSARIVGATAAPAINLIMSRPIGIGESYSCGELVGRGMNDGGYIEVMGDVAGMDFKFESLEFTGY
jgi:hypothetical protein